MKLAYIYPRNLYASWSLADGAVDALRRLGHKVLPVGHQGTRMDQFPSIQHLNSLDGIILSGPEHLREFILDRYAGEWPPKVPVVGWLQESVEREDKCINPPELAELIQPRLTFCPSRFDTKHGYTYLPFGVDTKIFHPTKAPRDIPLGFIGSIYPKRAMFLDRLNAALYPFAVKTGNVKVEDLDGVNLRASAMLYADWLRRIKVFVNLPSMSRLVVAKAFEVLACGCILVEERKPAMEAELSHLFPFTGVVPYSTNDVSTLADDIRWYLAHVGPPKGSTDHTLSDHRIEARLNVLVKAIQEATK